MTHANIDIESAPFKFWDSLSKADREGNGNGAVDSREEAWETAREYCRSEPADCDKVIDFLSDYNHYFPQNPQFFDKMPPQPKRVNPLPPDFFEGFKYFRYYGLRRKPKFEFNWGAPSGIGFYKVRPFYSNASLRTFNPMIEFDFNFTERARGSYEAGYAITDSTRGFTMQFFEQKLGAAYDILHDWPERGTRRDAVEMLMGGGALVKSVFISRGDETASSVNYGGYVIAELGTAMLWGQFSPMPIQEGWTKLFVMLSSSTGEDVTDFIILTGGKYCFEEYEEPPPDKKKKSGR